MSLFDYLDEEYFKLQDFLSGLIESLPCLAVPQIKDQETLIRSLVEQNKAYGLKIISLFETLDSVYKSGSSNGDIHLDSQQQQQQPSSPDFTSRLHKKIMDYEELIKKLTIENEEFASQIKNLSKQIEVIHAKYNNNNSSNMAMSQISNQGGNSNNSSAYKAISHSNSNNNMFNGMNNPSSLTTNNTLNNKAHNTSTEWSSSLGHGLSNVGAYNSNNNMLKFNDISYDLENLFINAEYTKACELLANIDYKRPTNLSIDKYCNWLIMTNRIKDFHINEIYNKLQIVISFSSTGGANPNEKGILIGCNEDCGVDEYNNPNLMIMSPRMIGKSQGNLGQHNGFNYEDGGNFLKGKSQDTIFDRIINILDEKIPKIVLKAEYEFTSDELTPNRIKSQRRGFDTQQSPVGNSNIIQGNNNASSGGGGNNEAMHMTANFNTSLSNRSMTTQRISMDDGYTTIDQYKMKVRYLNQQLVNFEKQLEEKSIECEILKDRLDKAIKNDGNDMATKGNNMNYPNENNNLNNLSLLTKDLEELRKQFDKENNKIEDLKKQLNKESLIKKDYEIKYQEIITKYENLIKDTELKDQLLEEMTYEKEARDNQLKNLIAENEKLKEQIEFIEKLEDIEKLHEALQEKEAKIRLLTDELNNTNINKTRKGPNLSSGSVDDRSGVGSGNGSGSGIEERKYINDIGPDSMRINSAREHELSKGFFLIESNLQNENSGLMGIQQLVDHIKTILINQLNNLNLFIPENTANSNMDGELGHLESQLTNMNNVKHEIKTLLKTNFINIKNIFSNVEYLKSLINGVINFVNDFNPKYVLQAEDNLLNNLSMAYQVISQIMPLMQTSSLSVQLSTTNTNTTTTANMQILSLIQNLHSNLSKAIREFPVIEINGLKKTQNSKESSSEKSKNVSNNSVNLSSNSKSLREKLVKDFDDIATVMKNTFFQLEKQQTNDNFTILNEEIQKNQDLKNECEAKTLLIHRLNLLVNEGFARIKVPIESLMNLADSEEAQVLLGFIVGEIANTKVNFEECIAFAGNKDHSLKISSKVLPQTIEKLEKEYESQKKHWQKSLEDLSKLYEDRMNKLIVEIEHERKDYEKLILEANESFKKNQIIDNLQNQIKDLSAKFNETEGKLAQKTNDFNEESKRYSDLEKEYTHCMDESIQTKDLLEKRETESKELKTLLANITEENEELKQSLNDIIESKKEYDETLDSKCKLLQKENEQLMEHKIKTELIVKKTAEQIDQIKLNYYNEINVLKDENNKLIEYKNKLGVDLEKKTKDLQRLSDMMDELQSFSNKQLEALKAKEEKLNHLTSKLRESENVTKILEKKLGDSKDKNTKSNESLLQYKDEIKKLKNEFNDLIAKHKELDYAMEVANIKNKELADENEGLHKDINNVLEQKKNIEEKLEKVTDLLQITKSELKNARESAEKNTLNTTQKDWELKKFKESIEKEREKQGQKDADTIQLLKRDINNHKNELLTIRREYQLLQEVNTKLQGELETLRSSSQRMIDQTTKGYDKSNKNLNSESQNLRKTTRQKDEEHDVIDKEGYIKEIQALQKKVNDLQNVIESKEVLLKSLPISFSGIDSIKSTASYSPMNSNFMNGLIESKDLEIKRLTQIVKTLTENLKETQESKFSLKKMRKQKGLQGLVMV